MSYKKLSIEEREAIHALVNQGMSNRAIGRELNRSHSTISRELKRCGSKYNYSPTRANNQARKNFANRGRKKLLYSKPEAIEEMWGRLIKKYSPEQISKSLKAEYPEEPWKWISHETTYRYIYALPRGELKKLVISRLRQKKRLRKNRKNLSEKRGSIPDAASISERPKEVDDRRMPGHWEGDLIIGKNHKTALGTLVERTTRMVFLVPVKGRDAKSVREAFSDIFSDIDPEMRKTLTYDRGHEMSEHKEFTQHTGMPVYFCDPNSPWQRGTNENTNGLIRQYFPKGTDFSKVSLEEIKDAQNELNARPRKVLNWDNPLNAFNKLIKKKHGAVKS